MPTPPVGYVHTSSRACAYSVVVFVNTSFLSYNTNIVNKFSEFNSSICELVNSSIVNYVTNKKLTSLSTMDNYNESLTIHQINLMIIMHLLLYL